MAFLRRNNSMVDRAWRTDRRWSMAFAVGAFPVLFIMDESWDLSFSPVLPGLLGLLVIWLAAPYVAMEVRVRRRDWAERPLLRHETASRFGLGVAFAWFVLWLVFA